MCPSKNTKLLFFKIDLSKLEQAKSGEDSELVNREVEFPDPTKFKKKGGELLKQHVPSNEYIEKVDLTHKLSLLRRFLENVIEDDDIDESDKLLIDEFRSSNTEVLILQSQELAKRLQNPLFIDSF
jgi:hypothetical protein